MTRRLALLALALAAGPAAAQVPADKTLATMQPGAGFQVELFAAEPMLVNPTSMDVDHKGRVWVAEAVNYRRKNFNRPILREEGDRVVVLTDTNGDGKADQSTVFYQGKDLYGPLSVCVIPQADGKALRVLVAQSPDILEFWDRDGDLKADGPPTKFLSGFRGFDHDHGVHGLSVGPDGKLYFTVGDSGVDGLQSSDKTGRIWKSNDTDCRAGTVWRCDLDGKNLELIAHNFRNNYEACVDSFGEIWLSDNDDDGNQQTRICHVMPGGNYGYHPRGPGQSHWHEEQPGIVHKTLRTGFGSPTGIAFNEGSLFGDKYRGALLHCDAGPREVRAFFRKPKGAGYELDKEVILTSTDNWFRPSDVCVGPDGSIFVADWYDPGVGGHGMGDWKMGRIFRLTPKGHTGYKVPAVKLDTPDGILAALSSPCLATQALATATLDQMAGQQAAGVVKSGLGAKDPIAVARAIQQAGRLARHPRAEQLGGLYPKLSEWSLAVAKGKPEAEQLLVRLFGGPTGGDMLFVGRNQSFDYPKWLKQFDISVCREFLLALNDRRQGREFRTQAGAVTPWIYDLAKKYDGKDIFYLAALNIACGTDPKRRDAILADFDKHFPEWNDTVADLVWELRPKSVLPRLGTLLADAKLTAPQKARIVDILAASDDPAAGQTMLGVLKSDAAPEVKARALDQLRLFLPTKWKGLRGGKELTAAVDGLLADPKTTATGFQLVAAANLTDRVGAVAAAAKDAKAPLDTRKQAVQTLGKLPGDEAVAALVSVGSPENPLSIPAIQALGELLPKGPKPAAHESAALDALTRGVFAADRGSAELKAASLAALAGNRAGTLWLLDKQAKKELPAELVATAGRLLRNSPFQGERNRALVLFPAPGKLDPKKLPSPAELAKRTGDAGRGQKVWADSLAGAAQCAKCHMVRGQGGQVGPDLSMIGVKGSRENLFESILNPSKAVADQYVQNVVTTTADLTVTGLVVSEADGAVTIRDANGKDTVIKAADIESRKKSLVSIMPEDIVAALTEDELVDLVAYLETLKTAAYTPDAFRVHGPYPAESMAAALDKVTDPPATGGKLLRPDAKGYFDLAALHGNAANNSASYLLTAVESPVEQEAEVRLGTDDGAKLWVNGAELFKTAQTRAAAPDQDTVKVKLKKGPNVIMVKVANGNNPHGLYFALLSAQEVKGK